MELAGLIKFRGQFNALSDCTTPAVGDSVIVGRTVFIYTGTSWEPVEAVRDLAEPQPKMMLLSSCRYCGGPVNDNGECEYCGNKHQFTM